jgi:flagellar biosynthesis/type III secretory pathway chaperone
VEYLGNAVDELVGILDVQLDQYRDLLRLLRAQREAFAAGDIRSFEETSKQQGTVVLKIKTLEEARKSIVLRLAQYFGVPAVEASGFTLAELATLMGRPYSDRFSVYREDILSLVKELENLKESNAYLIQHALHYVSGILKIFASTHSVDFAYSSSGQLEQKAEKGKRVSGWG